MTALDQALKIAHRSTHKRHMTGCVIMNKRGEIVSTGWAHMNTWRMRELYSMHAEQHALFRARHLRKQLVGCSVIVVTLARKSGAQTNSVPCVSCANSLIECGIEYAVCQIGGEFEQLHLPGNLAELKVYPHP